MQSNSISVAPDPTPAGHVDVEGAASMLSSQFTGMPGRNIPEESGCLVPAELHHHIPHRTQQSANGYLGRRRLVERTPQIVGK